jgi:hypothetical protein
MALPPLPLATVEELRLIADTAQRGIDDYFYADDEDDDLDEDDDARRRQSDRLRAAIAAARFCADVAADMGAAELCPLIVDILHSFPHFDHVPDDDVRGLAGAVAHLLRRGAPITDGIAELARHSDERLRFAMAKGIRPDDDFETALLTELAADPVAEIRNAARASLAERGALPWWHGKLSRDPMEGLSPEEQHAHKEALARVAEIMDLPSHSIGDAYDELARLAEGLPDAIAVDVAESMLRQAKRLGSGAAALALVMVSRPGGLDAILRTLRRWGDDSWGRLRGTDILVAAIEQLPLPKRRAIVDGLVQHAIGATLAERTKYMGAVSHAAEIAKKAWIAGDDTEPLLDTLLALEPPPDEEDDDDFVVQALSPVLSAPPAEPARMFQRALAARLAGHPAALKRLSHALDNLLDEAPGAMIREAAFTALTHEDDEIARWALQQVLGSAHDPALDPPLPEQIERLLAVPRYRAFICHDHALAMQAIAPLRRELRSGSLPLDEAQAVIKTIGLLWGGVAESLYFRRRGTDEYRARREKAEAETRQKHAASLGPPELHGPPTEAEWRVLREARLRARDPDVYDLVNALPEGETWHADDLAALERAIDKAGDTDSELLIVSLAISTRATPESLRLFDRLAARYPRAREVRGGRRIVAKLLGAAPDEPAEPEWMDEPED